MMKRSFHAIASPLRDLFVEIAYPRTCASCGQRGTWVCDLCVRDHTPLLTGLCCDRCGHPVILGRCACRMMHPAIAKARAPSVYDGWIADAVRAFKYRRERDRAHSLADQMSPALMALGRVDALIPVPLHTTRRDWRGFNQAELLSNQLGDKFAIPVESALQRIKETETQTHSNREERLANMEDAFALNPNWSIDPEAHYVLVDDVYTTGATVGACADVLDAAGAKSISVIAIAFDLQPRDLALYRDMLRSASP